MKNLILLIGVVAVGAAVGAAVGCIGGDVLAGEVIKVWPAKPPGETTALPAEADTTTDSSDTVAGRRLIRLGNVSTPTVEIFQPAPVDNTGAAVVICPGGGHRILAYDLEGTEVAEWLQSIGVTAFVLKYRVPARDPDRRWTAAVQDVQRAVSVVRHQAKRWNVDPQRIGLLGFSAGGQAAALASVRETRAYDAIDEIDQVDRRPNFTVLVYPAYLVDDARENLLPEVTVSERTPPMFLVHAFNDGVPVENSLLLFLAMKRAGVQAELHAFADGGHGFGMRPTDEPSSQWPEAMERWLVRRGYLKSKP